MAFIEYADTPQVKINDFDMEDVYKLCIVGRPEITTPQKKIQEYDLDGGSMGNIFVDTGWENNTIKITFNVLEESTATLKSFRERFSQIRSLMMRAKTIIFNDQPNATHYVKKVIVETAQNDFIEYGIFSVSFTTEPFARINNAEPVVITGVSERNFPNNGYFDCYPSMVFTGLQSGKVFRIRIRKAGTNEVLWELRIIGNGTPSTASKLVVDGIKKIVYWESASGVKTYPKNELTMLNFPILPFEGNHTIQVLTWVSGQTVTIDKNEVV